MAVIRNGHVSAWTAEVMTSMWSRCCRENPDVRSTDRNEMSIMPSGLFVLFFL